MAIDKGSPVTIFSSQSLAAAATLTGDWIDWTEKQAMTVFIKITQGGTATTTRRPAARRYTCASGPSRSR